MSSSTQKRFWIGPLVSAGQQKWFASAAKPLGKRERTHAHSPVLGVQANLIAFSDACTFSHRPSACEGSPIAKFRHSLNSSNSHRVVVHCANKSKDAKTSVVHVSSSRQRPPHQREQSARSFLPGSSVSDAGISTVFSNLVAAGKIGGNMFDRRNILRFRYRC